MAFLLAAPGVDPAAFSTDVIVQLGQRNISINQRGDSLEIDGNLTLQEAQTVLAGHAARIAQAEQQRQERQQARDALRARLTTLAGSTTALTNTQRDTALRDVARALLELGL